MPDLSLPGQPPPPLFFPPFPNEEKMRRGRLNAEAPLGNLGETHSVGRGECLSSSTFVHFPTSLTPCSTDSFSSCRANPACSRCQSIPTRNQSAATSVLRSRPGSQSRPLKISGGNTHLVLQQRDRLSQTSVHHIMGNLTTYET